MASMTPAHAADIIIPGWLLPHQELLPTAKLVYGRLAALAAGEPFCIELWRLSRSLGLAESVTRLAADHLHARSLIHRTTHGPGRPDRYQLLDHPWQHEEP